VLIKTGANLSVGENSVFFFLFDTLSVPKVKMEQTGTYTTKEQRFKNWVQEYSDMLYTYTIVRGFDHDNAKDFVQETFCSAWRNMEGFEGKASAKNWLFVILKNKITDHYRKVSTHINVQLSEYDTNFDESGHWAKLSFPKELTIDPDDASDQNEFEQILTNCGLKLSKIQKAVFFMKYLDDLERDDICFQLSITHDNYWTLLHRAKVQLRACLQKNWMLTKGI
jgi:RNA polymerase sigma-70 factor (TIGR02943 family)